MVDERIEGKVDFFLLPSFSNPFFEHALFIYFLDLQGRITYELNESKMKEDDNKVDLPMIEQLKA